MTKVMRTCMDVRVGLKAEHRRIDAFELLCWAQFPARRREERGCGPVTGKDRASCQSGGAPALRPGATKIQPHLITSRPSSRSKLHSPLAQITAETSFLASSVYPSPATICSHQSSWSPSILPSPCQDPVVVPSSHRRKPGFRQWPPPCSSY